MEKKSRILYVYKLLNEKTDENNPITVVQIKRELEKWGFEAFRKTIHSDIRLLKEFGVDIVSIKSSQIKYYVASRTFQIPEIKLLIDAVESSRFITSKKSKELIKMLGELTSENQAKKLGRNIFVEKRVKPANEEILYIIDTIQEAIEEKIKVSFKYYDYLPTKRKTYKNSGFKYSLSPYALCWSDNFYYVVGFCHKRETITQYRIDRIAKIEQLDEKATPAPKGFNRADYVKNMFAMHGGECKEVTLKCKNHLMRHIIDKFGKDAKTEILDNEHFQAEVDVFINPIFFGWCFQFAGAMEIVSPGEVADKYKNLKNDKYFNELIK